MWICSKFCQNKSIGKEVFLGVGLFMELLVLSNGYNTTCLACVDSPSASGCQRVKTCAVEQECFTDMYIKTSGEIGFDLGCRDIQTCFELSQASSKGSRRKRAASGDLLVCSQCCNGNVCNRGLCGQSGLQDNTSLLCYSCEIQLRSDSCDTIKRCNENEVCHLEQYESPLDGQLLYTSNCAQKSDCDSRAEEYSGFHNQTTVDDECLVKCCNTSLCNRAVCDARPGFDNTPGKNASNSVNGVWNTWSSWNSCSATCGAGLQRRERNCSNPEPSMFGDHCFGDFLDYRICLGTSCADQMWTSWGAWGACSATCGTGLRKRRRSCFESTLPMLRGECDGTTVEAELCFNRPCYEWTAWSHWGSCSTTCGVGVHYRQRHCASTSSHMVSRHDCIGNSRETESCRTDPCPAPIVSFRVRNVTNTLPKRLDTIHFNDVLHNQGSGYSSTTGVFSAPVTGVYMFTVQICPYSHQTVTYGITVNGYDVMRSSHEGHDVHTCVTFDAVAVLKTGDRVWVTCLHGGEEIYQNMDHWNTFSGVLLS